MKASSRGLEIEIYLTANELLDLEKKSLMGTLNFSDDQPFKRKIPLELMYNKIDKDNIDVKAKYIPPHTYFGESEKCTIIIYNYHYDKLLTTKATGDRFLGSDGKVLIYLNRSI